LKNEKSAQKNPVSFGPFASKLVFHFGQEASTQKTNCKFDVGHGGNDSGAPIGIKIGHQRKKRYCAWIFAFGNFLSL